MKSKKTKKALSGSVLALVLCFVMLIGTTFAWFTSSDSTAVNKIQAGTLDVDIVDENSTSLADTGLTFADKDGKTENILWEPGATFKTQGFKIKTTGNLALKYNFLLNGVNGSAKLLEAIEFSVLDKDGKATDIATFAGHLTATNSVSDTYYIQGHMKESAGNAYQGLTLEGIGIVVYATQDTVEYDSYNNTYDEKAELPTAVINTAAELRAALENGGNYVLMSDIDMTNVDWPALTVNSALTLDGNGHIISNLKIRHCNEAKGDTQYGFGFISNARAAVTIKNLTFTGADVGPEEEMITAKKGNIGGVVMGYSYGTTVLDNVTVTSSKVSGYGKLGCLIGYVASGSATLTDCKSTSNTINGGSNMGGLIGTVDGERTVVSTNGCTVTGITFNKVREEKPYTLATDVTVNSEEADKYPATFTLKAGGTYNLNTNGYYYSYSATYYNVIGDNYGSTTIDGTTYKFCEEWAVNG